ncbi:MAG: glycosyltransferase family 39 protein [Planctomycetes bacterium]|nr:glycosyltransferase family 39 protein [Planctomycetota bacterium]
MIVSRNSAKFQIAALAIIILLGAALRAVRLDSPFRGVHDSDNTIFGSVLQAQLKWGPLKTHFEPIRYAGSVPYENLYKHPSHWPAPIAVCWAIATIAGAQYDALCEWQVRLGPFIFSIVGMIAFYFLLARLLDEAFALLATLFLATSPFFVCFDIHAGSFLSFELMCAFLGLNFLLRYLENRGGRGSLIASLVLLSITCFSTWSGSIGFVVAFAMAVWIPSGKEKRAAIALIIAGIVSAGLLLAYIHHVGLLEGFGQRFSKRTSGEGTVGIAEFAMLGGKRTAFAVSPVLLILAAGWFFAFFASRGWKNRDGLGALILGIFVWCALALVVFRNALVAHEYYWHGFSLGCIVAGAHMLRLAYERFRHRPRIANGMVVAITLLTLGWFAWGNERRFSQTHGYPLEYPLAAEIREIAKPDEEVMTNLAALDYYANYYSGRYILANVKSAGAISEARKDSPSISFRTFVTMTLSGARSIPEFRDLSSAELDRFGIIPDDDPLIASLNQICGEPEESGGFLFYKLPAEERGN